MRTYTECAVIVNGKKTSTLEIFHEHNAFNMYEYGMSVFSTTSFLKAKEFTDEWKAKHQPLAELYKSLGANAEVVGGLK